jgi:hypothetical protein
MDIEINDGIMKPLITVKKTWSKMTNHFYEKQSEQAENSRLFLILLSCVLLVPSVAFSGRPINLPMEEKFDTNSYESDLIWTSAGGRHEWVPHGGWHGTGAAKFYPPTSGEGNNGIGQLENINGGQGAAQLNIRFLVYHGPDWGNVRKPNKVAIMNRSNDTTRPMFISWYNEEGGWRSLGACEGTVCKYHNSGQDDYWPSENDTFRIGPGNRLGEWISVEVETNTITGKMKVYIYTQDGQEHGLYAEKDMVGANSPYGPGTPPIHYVDIVGGYFAPRGEAPYTDDTYYMIDELKVDDSYIGPPSGFIDGDANSMSVEVNGNTTSSTIRSYGGRDQDINGTATSANNGTALSLSGNVWKKLDLGSLNITRNTMLEFDFSSTTRGEIHGIGFDNDNAINSNRTFKLYGSQRWGIGTAGTYGGSGLQHFVIPVGQYFTGRMRWLTFTNDHDVTHPTADSWFSNLRIYEAD